jgi:hypothetical protein
MGRRIRIDNPKIRRFGDHRNNRRRLNDLAEQMGRWVTFGSSEDGFAQTRCSGLSAHVEDLTRAMRTTLKIELGYNPQSGRPFR